MDLISCLLDDAAFDSELRAATARRNVREAVQEIRFVSLADEANRSEPTHPDSDFFRAWNDLWI